MNCWKQNDHIMGILLAPRGRPQRTFMEKFLEGARAIVIQHCVTKWAFTPGRDEDQVLPAATGIVHPHAP